MRHITTQPKTRVVATRISAESPKCHTVAAISSSRLDRPADGGSDHFCMRQLPHCSERYTIPVQTESTVTGVAILCPIVVVGLRHRLTLRVQTAPIDVSQWSTSDGTSVGRSCLEKDEQAMWHSMRHSSYTRTSHWPSKGSGCLISERCPLLEYRVCGRQRMRHLHGRIWQC